MLAHTVFLLTRNLWRLGLACLLAKLAADRAAACCPPAMQRKGQTVLVTAAAGGTGQLAVQLAVLAGCTVIGTCSGGDKERLLRLV